MWTKGPIVVFEIIMEVIAVVVAAAILRRNVLNVGFVWNMLLLLSCGVNLNVVVVAVPTAVAGRTLKHLLIFTALL